MQVSYVYLPILGLGILFSWNYIHSFIHTVGGGTSHSPLHVQDRETLLLKSAYVLWTCVEYHKLVLQFPHKTTICLVLGFTKDFKWQKAFHLLRCSWVHTGRLAKSLCDGHTTSGWLWTISSSNLISQYIITM